MFTLRMQNKKKLMKSLSHKPLLIIWHVGDKAVAGGHVMQKQHFIILLMTPHCISLMMASLSKFILSCYSTGFSYERYALSVCLSLSRSLQAQKVQASYDNNKLSFPALLKPVNN